MAKTIDQKKGITLFQLATLYRMILRASDKEAGEAFKAFIRYVMEGIDPYSIIQSSAAAFILDALYPSKEDSERVYLQKAIDGRYGAYKQECNKNDDVPEDRETWEKTIDFPSHPDDYIYSTDDYFVQAISERRNSQGTEMVWNPKVDHGIPEDTEVDHGIPKDSTVDHSNRIKLPKTDKKSNRHRYGEYGHVLLTDDQLEKLREQFPKDLDDRIKEVDEYCEETGKRYKNPSITIRRWKLNGTRSNANENGGYSYL